MNPLPAFPSRLKSTVATALLSLAALIPAFGVTVDDFEARVYDPDDNSETLNMPHRIFYPEDTRPDETYPLVIILHGVGGGNGDNITQMMNHGNGGMFFAEDDRQAMQPAYVVLPQEPGETNDRWHQSDVKPLLNGLVDSLLVEFPDIDPDRIYIGGVSMGGQGTWDQITSYPDKYAAGIVMAGAGGTGGANKITDLPVWLLHSAPDSTVNVARSDDRTNALRSLGGSPIYTRFDNGGHVIGPRACRMLDLYAWMIGQTNGEAPQAAPLLRITEYSVDSQLDIRGVAVDETVRTSQVDWSNSAGGSGATVLGPPMKRNAIFIADSNRDTIVISTDKLLDHDSVPDLSRFILGGSVATPKTATNVTINNGDYFCSITFDSDFEMGDAPTLGYAVPVTAPIQSATGEELDGFSSVPVINRIDADTPSTFTDYFEEGTGYYGFTDWPFTETSYWVVGFKEYHPAGFDTNRRYPCIIDIHGIGFTERDPTTLNVGLAKFINNGNELESRVNGEKFIGLCLAGGTWLSTEEVCNMIEYAYNHPNIDPNRIYLGGLSGGAMSTLGMLESPYANDGVTDITQHVQKLAAVYALSGSIGGGYDQSIAASKPILIHHGETDTTRKPGNVAGLRKIIGPSVVFNCFQGLGHSGSVWDRIWYDGNSTTTLVTIDDVPSDPFKSIWQFFHEHRNNVSSDDDVNGATYWSAHDIALSEGQNLINVTATGWAYHDGDSGNTTFNQAVSIDYASPSGDVYAPRLVIVSPEHIDHFIETDQTTIDFTGTASDDTAVSSVTWETDRDESGGATGTDDWFAFIPLVAGLNRVSISAFDAAGNRHTQIFYVVRKEPGINLAPRVRAGPNLIVVIPQMTVELDASLGDDGVPVPSTVTWTKTSGPGTVTFGDANAVDTTATFSEPGTYVLHISADDSEKSAEDEITVIVAEAPRSPAGAGIMGINCLGPALTASDGTVYEADDAFRFGGGSDHADSSVVTGTSDPVIYQTGIFPHGSTLWDIPLPNGDYVVTLQQVTHVNSLGKNIADYLIEGYRVLNDFDVREFAEKDVAYDLDFPITVTDGELNIQQYYESEKALLCGIVIREAITGPLVNQAPVVDAGENQTVGLAQGVMLDASVVDDGLEPGNATPTFHWSKQSGPGRVHFATPDAEDSSARFSAAGIYVLKLTADDGELSASDTITVTVGTRGPPPRGRTVRFDFGGQVTPATGWNLMRYYGVGDGVTDAKDTDDNVTPIDLYLTDDFRGRDLTGIVPGGGFPDEAAYDSFYCNNANVGEMAFQDLDSAKAYDIVIFASSAVDPATPSVGVYTVNGLAQTFDAAGNTSGFVVFENIAPTAQGVITLHCLPQETTFKVYVNAIELAEKTVQAPIFVNWIGDFFPGEPGNPNFVGESADPDRDGMNNMLEYALGTNPDLPNSGLPQHRMRNGRLELSFNRPPESSLTYIVEASSTMAPGDWLTIATLLPGGDWTGSADVTETGTETVSVKVMDTMDLTFEPEQPRFIRLRVQEEE